MNKWQIMYDDSGESEYYGEFNWYITNELGEVLDDISFETETEAQHYLNEVK